MGDESLFSTAVLPGLRAFSITEWSVDEVTGMNLSGFVVLSTCRLEFVAAAILRPLGRSRRRANFRRGRRLPPDEDLCVRGRKARDWVPPNRSSQGP